MKKVYRINATSLENQYTHFVGLRRRTEKEMGRNK